MSQCKLVVSGVGPISARSYDVRRLSKFSSDGGGQTIRRYYEMAYRTSACLRRVNNCLCRRPAEVRSNHCITAVVSRMLTVVGVPPEPSLLLVCAVGAAVRTSLITDDS